MSITSTSSAHDPGLGAGVPEFCTVDETAATLKTNKKTVYDAIARKEIPAIRIGRILRVPGAWLRAQASNGVAA